jgi:hypothetical protein
MAKLTQMLCIKLCHAPVVLSLTHYRLTSSRRVLRGVSYFASFPCTPNSIALTNYTAGRMSAIGHLIGYLAGAIDLVSLLGTTLGDTQFKQLTVIATFTMIASSSITCWAVSEKTLAPHKRGEIKNQANFQVVRQIWSTLRHLPPRVQAICWAQFWAWIGEQEVLFLKFDV